MKWTAVVATTAIAGVLFGVVACGADTGMEAASSQSSSRPSPPALGSAPSLGRNNFSLAPANCPTGFSRITLTPDSPTVESTDLNRFIACSNPYTNSGYVKNAADEVWIIDTPSHMEWLGPAPSLESLAFRSTVQELEETGAIVVDGLPVEPGSEAYFTLPAYSPIHISVDKNVQGMWHGLQAVDTKAVTLGENAMVKLMSRNSTSRGAVLTCALEGYRIGYRFNNAEDPDFQLKDGLGVANSVRKCGQAINAVEVEANLRREAPLATHAESLRTTNLESFAISLRRGVFAALSRTGARL